MDFFNPDDLGQYASNLEESAALLLRAAAKVREALKLVELANAKNPLVTVDAVKAIAGVMPVETSGANRIEQINDVIRQAGRPLRRGTLMRLARQRGIPINTTASYVTNANFSYRDGYWWLKDEEWPTHVKVAGVQIPFTSLVHSEKTFDVNQAQESEKKNP